MPNATKRAPKSITPANPWVRGLYPGTHTSMSGDKITFTSEDISRHVDKVRAQVAPGMAVPPLVTGHPKHDDPRVGSVVDVELREDGAAWYKLDTLSPAFCEACQRGEYTYSSPKLNRDGSLRHLGALGAWNPSLKEQPGFAFGEAPDSAEADDGTLAFGAATDWGSVTGGWLNRLAWRLQSFGSILRRQREAMIEKDGVEAADKVLPDWEIKQIEQDLNIPRNIDPAANTSSDGSAAPAFAEPTPAPAAANPAPAALTPPAPDPAPAAAPDAQAAELARVQSELDAANRKLAEQRAAADEKAFGEKVDQTIAEGRLSPALATKFRKLFTSLSSSGQLAFAEGDPVRTELEEILGSLPKLVEFGELPDGRKPQPTTNPIIANAEARAAAAQEYN